MSYDDNGIPIIGPPPQNKDAEAAARYIAQQAYEHKQLSLQRGMLRTQIGLVVFGLVGSTVSIWQAKIAQQSADTTLIQTSIDQQANRASQRSSQLQLKASQDSLNATIRNFHQDQRPWIGFSLKPANITFTIGQTFSVPTLLINSGKTPARDVKGNIVVGLFRRGQPLEFSYSPGNANYRVNGGLIFPNGSIEENFQAIRHGKRKAEAIFITKESFDDILASRSLVIVHGKITYSDIFGQSHWTTYCRVVSNPSLIPDDCMEYNDSDEK